VTGFWVVFKYNDIIAVFQFYGTYDQFFGRIDSWLLLGHSVSEFGHKAVTRSQLIHGPWLKHVEGTHKEHRLFGVPVPDSVIVLAKYQTGLDESLGLGTNPVPMGGRLVVLSFSVGGTSCKNERRNPFRISSVNTRRSTKRLRTWENGATRLGRWMKRPAGW
jgi:hypothetical protein